MRLFDHWSEIPVAMFTIWLLLHTGSLFAFAALLLSPAIQVVESFIIWKSARRLLPPAISASEYR